MGSQRGTHRRTRIRLARGDLQLDVRFYLSSHKCDLRFFHLAEIQFDRSRPPEDLHGDPYLALLIVDVLDEAVRLRQERKMSLGDALVAATALVNNLALLSHNQAYFDWIEGLVVVDPIDQD